VRPPERSQHSVRVAAASSAYRYSVRTGRCCVAADLGATRAGGSMRSCWKIRTRQYSHQVAIAVLKMPSPARSGTRRLRPATCAGDVRRWRIAPKNGNPIETDRLFSKCRRPRADYAHSDRRRTKWAGDVLFSRHREHRAKPWTRIPRLCPTKPRQLTGLLRVAS